MNFRNEHLVETSAGKVPELPAFQGMDRKSPGGCKKRTCSAAPGRRLSTCCSEQVWAGESRRVQGTARQEEAEGRSPDHLVSSLKSRAGLST